MTPTETGSAKADAIAKALTTMWERFLPEIEGRIQVLDEAAAAVIAGKRCPTLRASAHQAAHKLAGTLGTFGLGRGTELAREAEILYTREEIGREDAARLQTIAGSIRTIVDERK